MFLNCSKCFGRHTAHHQELKTLIAASGFTYVFGCRPLRWLSHCSGRQPKTYVKPEAAITVFELLMMGGVSPETCWAVKKHWNNKFYYAVASCWFFLWVLYYDVRIREHQTRTLLSVMWSWLCMNHAQKKLNEINLEYVYRIRWDLLWKGTTNALL